MDFIFTPAGFFVWGFLQQAFLFLGIFVLAAFFRRRNVDAVLSLAAACAIYAALAMALFWLNMASLSFSLLSDVFRWAIIAGTFYLAAQSLCCRQWGDEIAGICLLGLCISFVMLVWVHAGEDPKFVLQVPAATWLSFPLPSDNALPNFMANAVNMGSIPTPLAGDWLSSDRPPLQTAMFMMTPGFVLWGSLDLVYQPAGIALQIFALLGTWMLCRAFTDNKRLTYTIIIAVMFTPLLLVNSVYVWPKLLAASFLLSVAALHFSPRYHEFKNDIYVGATVGALAACSMLAHGGSAFALIGMALAALLLRRVGSLRYTGAALVAFFILFGPWTFYQGFVDPPGNRLLKMHLAGVERIDNRSVPQTLHDSYTAQSSDEFMQARVQNAAFLFADIPQIWVKTGEAFLSVLSGKISDAAGILQDVRDKQFYRFVIGCGLLGLGIFLLPWMLVDPPLRPLVLIVGLTLAVWVLLMFQSGMTLVHHGSYFPQIALIFATAFFLVRRFPRAAHVIVALHIAVGLFQYSL